MKVIISDTESSHANYMETIILSECPTCIIEKRIETLSASIAYARSTNDVNIINRSTTGLDVTRDLLSEEGFKEDGFGVVHAHGSNSHVEINLLNYLGYICGVGRGANEINLGSYGNALEFFSNDSTQSVATARVTGIIAQLLIDNPSWNFHDARNALRQTASNYSSLGWKKDGGWGQINKVNAAAVGSLNLFSPIQTSITQIGNTIEFKWDNNPGTNFYRTIITKYTSIPARNYVPQSGDIIYEGVGEIFTLQLTENDIGNIYYVFYTRDISNNYSLRETFDTYLLTQTYEKESEFQMNLDVSKIVKVIKKEHITDIYDLLTGAQTFDNISINGVKTFEATIDISSDALNSAEILYDTINFNVSWDAANNKIILTLASGAFNDTDLIAVVGSCKGSNYFIIWGEETTNKLYIQALNTSGAVQTTFKCSVVVRMFPNA